MRRNIRLITFDAYNTLFKPSGSTTAQYRQEASQLGINVCRNILTQAFGRAYKNQKKQHPFYGFKEGMDPRRWWEELVYNTFLSAGVPQYELDPKFKMLFDSLYERFTSDRGYSTFPDVNDTLRYLKAEGITIGVISNSDERLFEVLLNLKIGTYFDFVLPSYRAGYEKPAHEIFDMARRIADPSNPIKPDEALHVGDDIRTDYEGAINAGWNALLLKRGKLSYEDVSSMQSRGELNRRPQSIMTLHELRSRFQATG